MTCAMSQDEPKGGEWLLAASAALMASDCTDDKLNGLMTY